MKALSKIKKDKSAKSTKASIDDASSQMDIIDDVLTDDYSTETAAEKNAPAVEVEDKVGSMLKSARIKKKLEIEDVAKKLCIRRVYLEAIEESDYEEIPDYPYGPGFVRSYADFLGLNGARLVQVFKDETNKKNKKTSAPYHPDDEAQNETVAPSKKYIIISIVFIIAVYLGWMFWNQYNNQSVKNTIISEPVVSNEIAEDTTDDTNLPLSVYDYADNNAAPATDIDSASEQLPVADVDVASDTINHNQEAPASENSVVEEPATEQPRADGSKIPSGVFIKVNQEVWVEARDNDKLYLSKVLKPGDAYALPNGGKNIKLSIGRYGSADIFVNGVLTEVVTPVKKTNIDMNEFLKKQQ